MVKCTVSPVVRIPEGMMIPFLLPVPYPIRKIRNDFREAAHFSDIRIIVRIKTEK